MLRSFFDNHELERLIEQSVDKSYWIDYHKLHSLLQYPLHKDKIIYRRCPVCNKIMHRKNYANRSGVIMDYCADHGVWLDAGELKQIQEWTKLGGKQNAMKDELDRKHRHNRARETKRASSSRSRHYESFSLDEPMRLDDLFDTLSSIFSFK
jgi:Zn-finger nucleic acid-binding protein